MPERASSRNPEGWHMPEEVPRGARKEENVPERGSSRNPEGWNMPEEAPRRVRKEENVLKEVPREPRSGRYASLGTPWSTAASLYVPLAGVFLLYMPRSWPPWCVHAPTSVSR